MKTGAASTTGIVGKQELRKRSRALTSDSSSKLNIFGHDGDTFAMDGAQVRVLEQRHQVGLGRFLQSQYGRALESQIRLEILSDLTDQALEWQSTDQQLSALLVFTNFSEGDGSGTESVRFLDTPRRWSGLSSRLG